jgi:hypothetical protein
MREIVTGAVSMLDNKSAPVEFRGLFRDPETRETGYEFGTLVPFGQPAIVHVSTGQVWTAPWNRLLALAKTEGLPDEEAVEVVLADPHASG